MDILPVGTKIIVIKASRDGVFNVGDTGEVTDHDLDCSYGLPYEIKIGEDYWWASPLEIASAEKAPQIPFQSLTMEEVDQVFNSLPGGLEGFCKGWGWYDFARY